MQALESKKTVLNLKKGDLKSQFEALELQFHNLLKEITVEPTYEDNRLSTYNPLEIVSGFEKQGLQKIKEVSRDEMLGNSEGLRKLLANMLSQCRPGALSREDVDQMTGINGREMRQSL